MGDHQARTSELEVLFFMVDPSTPSKVRTKSVTLKFIVGLYILDLLLVTKKMLNLTEDGCASDQRPPLW